MRTEDLLAHLRRATFSLVVLLVLGLALTIDRAQLRADLIGIEARLLAIEAEQSVTFPFDSFEKFICANVSWPLVTKNGDNISECEALYSVYGESPLSLLIEALMSPSSGRRGLESLFLMSSDLKMAEFYALEERLQTSVVIEALKGTTLHPMAAVSETPEACQGQEEEPWFVSATIKDESYLEPHSFVISNARTIDRDATGQLCTKIGPVDVFLPEDLGESLELKGFTSYEREIGRVGWRWGEASSDPKEVYSALRSRYELGRVRVPVLGIDIDTRVAMLGLSVLAMSLLAWLSFLMRLLVPAYLREKTGLWLVVAARTNIPETGFARAVAVLELAVFLVYIFLAFTAPLAISLMAWLVPVPGSPAWSAYAQGAVLVLSGVFLFSCVRRYVEILRN